MPTVHRLIALSTAWTWPWEDLSPCATQPNRWMKRSQIWENPPCNKIKNIYFFSWFSICLKSIFQIWLFWVPTSKRRVTTNTNTANTNANTNTNTSERGRFSWDNYLRFSRTDTWSYISQVTPTADTNTTNTTTNANVNTNTSVVGGDTFLTFKYK